MGYLRAALVSLCLAAAPGAAQDLTAGMIEKMGNNSLFTRWRPYSHFIAPAGWMNDPCAPMYDAHRDTYHLFYQWHPNHVEWGNISWGHATSKDLITWTDVGGWKGDGSKALGTGGVGTYNGLGIFSGTGQPVNLQGVDNGDLSIFYTSVQHLPTSYSLHYIPHTETQSIATSKDGGRTWQYYDKSPVVREPPKGWNITGWRDPFVEPFPELDQVIHSKEPHYYAVLGSGIKEVGPRIPLYQAMQTDLTKWTFLGALWEPKQNTSLGSVLETGSYGFNFEVSGFFPLEDCDGTTHYFTTMGSEGGNVSFHPSSHWALWNGGSVSARSNGSIEFHPSFGGATDWGLLYAVTSFWDSKHRRRVQWGWAPEDSNDFGVKQAGYQGSMGLPRWQYIHEVDGVMPSEAALAKPGNALYKETASRGCYSAKTLGVTPLPDVVDALRKGADKHTYAGGMMRRSKMLDTKGSSSLALQLTLSRVTGSAGVSLATSPDGEETTTIAYHSTNNTLIVHRWASSRIKKFAAWDVVGYFAPYKMYPGGETESICMDIYLDGSLLEVFVNGRFALTTRVYPGREDSTGFGVWIGKGSAAKVSGVTAWKGLKNVWPGRPRDSSSELVYDTPKETDDYTWWAGY